MLRTSSLSRLSLLVRLLAVGSLLPAMGCSLLPRRVVLVGKPAPVPSPNVDAVADFNRLRASWCWRDGLSPVWEPCLQDHDALIQYLSDVEQYRCYIAELRDEKVEGCEE